MNVEGILAGKGRDVVTMRPDDTVADAVAALNRHRIGAVLVTEGTSVVGIVSERDIVRSLGDKGAAALQERLGTCMTARPRSCSLGSGIDELMEMMTVGKFRHVPVVEAGRLVGIVSIGDVVKNRLAAIESEHAAMRDYIATA